MFNDDKKPLAGGLIPNNGTKTVKPPVNIPPHKIVFNAPPQDPSKVPPPSPVEVKPETNSPVITSSSTENIGSFVVSETKTAPIIQPSSTYIPGTYTPGNFSQAQSTPPVYTPPPIPTSAQATVNQAPVMRSFAYDIKSAVDNKGVDMAHIILSENRKREALGITEEDLERKKSHVSIIKVILITFGVIATLGGVGALFLVYSRTSPVIRTGTGETFVISPFVRTEKNTTLTITDSYKSTLLDSIDKIKTNTGSPETIEGLAWKMSFESNRYVDTSKLLELTESETPETLKRALDPRFSLGLYGGERKTYLIIKSTSYDNAYAGMMEWEKTLSRDLGPLFFQNSDLYSATTSNSVDSEKFVDKIYSNIDTRAVLNSEGQPVMLWAIINRTFIVITKDQETLEALTKRMTTQNVMR